jgi:hypothetical protein
MMDFNDLLGRSFPFHGVDAGRFALTVDGTLTGWEAVEDEHDDYRSMMSDILPVSPAGLTVFKNPIASVRVESADDEELDGYRLVDTVSGHVWLSFGTNDFEDYYPLYIFDYTPDTGQQVDPDVIH